MDVFKAIDQRRSVGTLSMDQIIMDDIKTILDAANKAPNHHRIRPWRFTVIQGEALEKFADAHEEAFKRKFPEATHEQLAIERKKGLRAPLVISVTSKKPETEKHDDIENISAAAAACQNILLAATGLGYASYWRTTIYLKDAYLSNYLGVDDSEHLIGVIFIGKPLPREGEPSERPSFEDRVTWY